MSDDTDTMSMRELVDRDGNRRYLFNGQWYPSVTTVLGLTKGAFLTEDWPVITTAKMAMANPEANKAQLVDLSLAEMHKGREIGTAVHNAIAERMDDPALWNVEIQDPLVRSRVKSFSDWLVSQRTFRAIASEVQVVSHTHGYAGRLDLVALLNGMVSLCDYKTGKDVWQSTALQLAAYRHADLIYPDLPMPKVERCGVIHVRPRKTKLVEMEAGPEQFDAFLNLLAAHRVAAAYGQRHGEAA